MITSQRKTHLWLWIGIALIVPVLIFFALKNRNIFPETVQKFIIPQQEIGGIIKNIEHSDFTIHLRGQQEISQLEIILKTPLKAASATIYDRADTSKSNPIGTLQDKNVYRFPIHKNCKGILIYDHIKQQELYTLSF